jgi:hypothetical protein
MDGGPKTDLCHGEHVRVQRVSCRGLEGFTFVHRVVTGKGMNRSESGARESRIFDVGARPVLHQCNQVIFPLDRYAPQAYSRPMRTVVETLLFQRQWPLYWTEDERGAFAAYIAEHPCAGTVVPGSGGIRKVRWGRAGSGKSGGVRVIYFTHAAQGEVVLLTLYAKSKTDNLTGAKLKEIRRALEE